MLNLAQKYIDMKTKQLVLIFLLTLQVAFSQNCEDISPYKEGTKLEYTNYNKKGKEKSVDSYFVKSVTTNNGEFLIEIETTVEEKDKKKDKFSITQTLRCVNGNFYVNMSDYLAHQSEDQKSTLEIKAEGDFVEFPSNLKAGLALKDASIDLKMGGGEGTSAVSLANMKVLNRKVLQEDAYTSKAGTFNAYIMSFDYVFTIGFIKVRGSGKEWYVKGVGIVKTESYTKKGKLRWTRELTKLN